jgi:hypothetical protein
MSQITNSCNPVNNNLQFPQDIESWPRIIINQTLFCEKVVPNNNGYVLASSRLLNRRKLALFRNSIAPHQILDIRIPGLKNESLVPHLKNYLKILRLKPQNTMEGALLVDISTFVDETTRNFLLKKFCIVKDQTAHSFIPCLPKPLFTSLHSEEQQDVIFSNLTLSPDSLHEFLQVAPDVINGLVMSYLNTSEITTISLVESPRFHLPYVYPLLTDYFNKMASVAIHVILQNNSGGPPYYLPENIELIRKYVKHLDLSPLPGLPQRRFPVRRKSPNPPTSSRVSRRHPTMSQSHPHLRPTTPPRTRLTPQLIAHLALFFPNIKTLSLKCCDGSDTVLPELHNFKNLQSLDLSRSDVSGKTFAFLPPSLKKLNCAGCHALEDSQMGQLSSTSLEELTISHTPVKGGCFEKLPKSLRTLLCSGCMELENAAISRLKDSALVHLDISATFLSGENFSDLPKSLKSLRINVFDTYTSCAHLVLDNLRKTNNLTLLR